MTWRDGASPAPRWVDQVVIVAAIDTVATYDAQTGPGWVARRRGDGYSSPHLMTLDDVPLTAETHPLLLQEN